MKKNKWKILFVTLTVITVFITLFSYNFSPSRNVASLENDHYITVEELNQMGPLGLIQKLKEECCEPFMVETISTEEWISEDDVKALTAFFKSEAKVSAVVSVHSSLPCTEAKFISSLDREARHLINSKEEGQFPISMCSTYDLKLK